MIEKTFQKAMGFLQEPKAAFDREKSSEPASGFVYMALLSIITAVLSGIVSLFNPLGGAFIAIVIVGGYVAGIIGSVIAGLWLHLWAYIFGAKKGLAQTLKTVFYGGTPNYLLGWIPFLNILFSLWSIYLYWIGLQRLHSLPGNKSGFAILIAFIIPIIVLGLMVLIGLAMFSSLGGFGPDGLANIQGMY